MADNEKQVIIRGDSIYTIVDGPSWTEAEANSNKLGGHLITINDLNEYNWGYENLWGNPILNKYYYVGFNDSDNEGDYQWSSGEDSKWDNLSDLIHGQNWFLQNHHFEEWDYGVITSYHNPGFRDDNKWTQDGIFIDGSNRGAILMLTNDMPADIGRPIETKVNDGIAETPFIRRGDSAYVIVKGPTWEEAEANANKLGGHLVTINDADEDLFLVEEFGLGYFFGLNDIANEGIFEWVSGEQVTYTNWEPYQPTDSGLQDYGAYHPLMEGYWDDVNNGHTGISNGIAEIKLAPNNAPTGELLIDGELKVGETITIDRSNINDLDNFDGWTPTYNY